MDERGASGSMAGVEGEREAEVCVCVSPLGEGDRERL